MGRSVRRPVKKNGLPTYIDQFLDRHGGLRTRFRRSGYPTAYIKSPFPSREFWQEYDALVNGQQPPAGRDRNEPGSIADLVSRFIAVPGRLGPTPDTQHRNRRILELFRDKHGKRMVADVKFEALDIILSDKAEETPWQARKLRRLLKKMFDFAVKTREIERNPVNDTETIKATSEGLHTWTEAEIDQFVSRHPLGTKPYLAMMLMLWTGLRRSDAVRMRPSELADGWLPVRIQKTKRPISLPVSAQLIEAIEKAPAPIDRGDDTTFLQTSYGHPFTAAGFGNWFRVRCNEAGLPQCSAHGLRKAISRRMAEIDLSNQSIKSVTGHSTDSEVSRYTRDAEQAKMAGEAMQRLSAWALANLAKRLDK